MSAQEEWREYLCKACGYVYNERDGDVDGGLVPGTRFEDIPDDWYCPICGVSKADFVLVEGEQAAATRASRPIQIRVSTATHSSHRSSLRNFDVVIVGGGTAAWKAAESLRSFSPEISIALISQCDADRYDKPLLSVAMHQQFHLPDLVKESGHEAAQRLNAFLYTNTTAISLVPSRHIVRTTIGSIYYKKLIIAHGAKSVLPGHLPADYCWRINHLSQYVQFRESLGTGSRRVLVIGAGLIGSELANDLALGGHSVTLTDLAARPLERLLSDAKRSEALLKAWENLPIEFIGSTEVLAVKKNQTGGYDVSMSLGRNLSADAIVVATGLRTCDRLAASADLSYNNGIVVDPVSLRTSASDIYALGDCVTINGETSRYIEPIGRQAHTIASQIVGDTLVPYVNQPIPIRIKTSSMPMTVND